MHKLFFYIGAASLLIMPGIALAANLSVFPSSINLKKGDGVGFIVRMQSQDSINTIGASVVLPPNLAFLSVSNGTYSLAFDPSQTEVYKNDGNATPEPVIYSAAPANPFEPKLVLFGAVILIVLFGLFLAIRRRYKVTFV
jgi:hypothetical protein